MSDDVSVSNVGSDDAFGREGREAKWPGLRGTGHRRTSDPADYNCIAWAAGDKSRWWSHISGCEWRGTRTALTKGLTETFESLGFERCDGAEAEEGYEKVAVYEWRGMWRHAARLLPDGGWTSKLGEAEDIRHDAATDLCGPVYGEIHCYMRRPINGGRHDEA